MVNIDVFLLENTGCLSVSEYLNNAELIHEDIQPFKIYLFFITWANQSTLTEWSYFEYKYLSDNGQSIDSGNVYSGINRSTLIYAHIYVYAHAYLCT